MSRLSISILWFVFVGCAIAAQPGLEKLAPPLNASPKEAAAYFRKVRQSTRDMTAAPGDRRMQVGDEGTATFGRDQGSPVQYEDPDVVAKIAPLLPAHVDALLTECGKAAGPFVPVTDSIFTRSAFACLRQRNDWSEADRAIIYRHLGTLPFLLKYVVGPKKWIAEAEPAIADAAYKINDDFVRFARVLAQLPSEKSRNALYHLLTQIEPGAMVLCLEAAQEVRPKALDWDKVVADAWTRIKKKKDQAYGYAKLAARYGHQDALLVMAKQLREDDLPKQVEEALRADLNSLVPGEFKNASALANYVKQHEGKFVCDAQQVCYRVAESKP